MSRPGLHRMNNEDDKFLHEFLREHPEFEEVSVSDCYFKTKAIIESLPPEQSDQIREYERFMQISLKLAKPRIPDDDTEWVSKMLETSDEEGRKLIQDFLAEHPELSKLPFAEAGVWIAAIKQDLERDFKKDTKRRAQERDKLYRERGFTAPSDSRLILWAADKIAKKLKAPKIKMAQAFEYLRLQKRRTRKEQQALDTWDATSDSAFATDEEMDAMEAELESRWSIEDGAAEKVGKAAK